MTETSYEEAERVRDFLSDRILDGRKAISVGIKGQPDAYVVGVTATKKLKTLPDLPADLTHVEVEIFRTDEPARAH